MIFYIFIFITIQILLNQVRCGHNLTQINRIAQSTLPNYDETTNLLIFKPYPEYTTKQLQFCHIYQNSYVYYFFYDKNEYFAQSYQSCGFSIFNINDPQNPKLEVNFVINNGIINKFSFDTQRNFLWIANSNGNIYYVNVGRQEISNVKHAFKTDNNAISLFVSFVLNLKDTILVICVNQIQIFSIDNSLNSINDIESFKFYRSISLSNAEVILKIRLINNLLIVASQLKGLYFYSVSSGQSRDFILNLIGTLKPYNTDLWDFQITQKNILYIQMNTNGLYSYNANDCFQKGDLTSCQNIPYIDYQPEFQVGIKIILSLDENYMISQQGYIGIVIYDISKPKMKIFQIIDVEGDSVSLALNRDQTLILYSGTTQFYIFKRSNYNTIINKPNILLNIIQNTPISFYKDLSKSSSDLQCNIDSNRHLLFISRFNLGLIVLQQHPQGILETVINIENDVQNPGQVNYFYLFLDLNLVYLTQASKGLSIVDFTDPKKPVYIQNQIKFGVSKPNFVRITCNQKHQLCTITSQYFGNLLLDITNLKDPVLLSIYLNLENQLLGNTYFINQQKVVLSIVENFGVIVTDLYDSKNPKQISSLFTNKAKDLILTQDDRHLFLSTPNVGIIIVDISDLQSLKILFTINIPGTILNFYFMNNEKYLIVPAIQKPALYLISIQDLLQPKIEQIFKRKTQESFLDICFDAEQNEGYITTGKQLHQLYFKSQVIFQAMIFQMISIPGKDTKKYVEVDSSNPLFVGQFLSVKLVPLYFDRTAVIKKVFLYENYVLQPLKPWITFQSEQNLLQLSISKEALSQDQNGNYIDTIIQIIFQAHLALDSSSFMNTFLNIDLTTSTKILQECQSIGYLDSIFQVVDSFNPEARIQLNFENIFNKTYLAALTDQNKTYIINTIQYVFKHSIVIYPIEFKVSPSLSFDQADLQMEFIKSLRGQVVIYIRVSKIDDGKFVIKSYSGVLSVISQNQDEIKIEGDIKKVNQMLKQKIKFSSISPKENIKFSVTISDGVNYDIQQEISYIKALFISEQSKVDVNEGASIQNDFSKKFEDSSIYIREKLSYQISSDIFIGEEIEKLVYSAKIENLDGEYIDIPLNHWLQFSKNDKIITGAPSEKELNQIVKLQIKITDNYSYIVQTLTINVSRIPILYIIQIIVQIIGPLLGLLGFWKYKYKLINMLQKKKYNYEKEIIEVGQSYQKQILINNWNLHEANKILKVFTQIVQKKEIQKYILQHQQYKINQEIQISSRFGTQENQNKPLNQEITHHFYSSSDEQTQINQFDEIVEHKTGTPSQRRIALLSNKLQHKLLLQRNKSDSMNVVMTNKNIEVQALQKPDFSNTESKMNVFNQTIDTSLNKKEMQQSDISIYPLTNQIKQNKEQDNTIVDSQVDTRKNKNSGKRFKKLFQKQLEKTIQQSIDNNQNFEIKQNQNENNNKFVLQLFTENGNIDYTGVIQFFIEQSHKKGNFDEEIKIQMLNQNSLLRQTFECFLAEYILQQDIFSHNLFQEIYYKLHRKSYNPQWYKLYCQIKLNVDDIHINPVPQIIFKNSIIEQEIKSLIFDQSQQIDGETLKRMPLSLNLIKETIKGYALGFISNQVKLKPKSFGESIHIETHNINQIKSYSEKGSMILPEKNKFCQKLKKKDFIEKALIKNSRLPPWIKSVEIINNNLLILGYPEKKDIGRVYINIESKQKYIIRAFEIEVDYSKSYIDVNQKNVDTLNSKHRCEDSIVNSFPYRQDFLQLQKNNLVKKQDNFIEQFQKKQSLDTDTPLNEGDKQPHINQFTQSLS